MSDNKGHKKPLGKTPKNIKYFNGRLGCQRCANTWQTVDLNPERKIVGCPICGEQNDIKEAIKRAS